MKEQLELLFENWLNPKTRDEDILSALYSKVKGVSIDKCPKCKAKAIQELRKYYELTFNTPLPEYTGRKYVLMPGDHQFVSGETVLHNNENTSDSALELYLKAFPYIKSLFIKIP